MNADHGRDVASGRLIALFDVASLVANDDLWYTPVFVIIVLKSMKTILLDATHAALQSRTHEAAHCLSLV
jgi:hypothetical protein